MKDAMSLIFGNDTPAWMREPFDPLDWDKLRLMFRLFWTEIAANEEAKPYLAAAAELGLMCNETMENIAIQLLTKGGPQ